jgi:peptidoglycan/LPS O-acetylase OafA/YrhL
MRMNGESRKNRDIQILRAVAITYVIAMHWVPHFLGRFGSLDIVLTNYTALWSGVDLFFCISGYVIAKSILREAVSGATFRDFVLPFWMRRIFRLWPSAWLWAVLAVLLVCISDAPGASFDAAARALSDAAAAILNVANFHYYQCLPAHSCGSLTVYWSLSVEEQFYWIFPLLLLLLPRPALIVLLVTLAAVQIVLPRPNSFETTQPSLLWLVRTDAICLGILLALLESSRKWHLPSFSLVPTPLYAWVISCVLLIFARYRRCARPPLLSSHRRSRTGQRWTGVVGPLRPGPGLPQKPVRSGFSVGRITVLLAVSHSSSVGRSGIHDSRSLRRVDSASEPTQRRFHRGLPDNWLDTCLC